MAELKDFHGKIMKLEGVDTYIKEMPGEPYFYNEPYMEDCQALSFKLDGVVYTAVEDPGDGYRSHMRDLLVNDIQIKNTFEGVEVEAVYLEKNPEATWDYGYDVLQLVDTTTKAVVLSVGTANVDDYYPYFVSQFDPKAMSVNQR